MSVKRSKKAYLDSNVLIEYAWERSTETPSTRKKKAGKLIELGIEGKFDIYVSTFGIMELYEHFRDWYLMQNVIRDGFGYREFRRERKNHKLTNKEAKKLEELVARFRDDPNIYHVEFDKVPEDFFPRVIVLLKNGIECMDAFHLLTALDIGVTHFVTEDGEVRSRFNKATRTEIESPPMEMTNIKGFL
ncbi:MAG: PIN domain-containing protein [Thermoplasmata archaeon]|nr:PIN domain-containing protein [Thermoplasmata archaeon]